ncbi:MAG: hypothetical protein ABIA12_02165 [Candidatus Aenigmatarchaeota archaeon]
MRPKTESHKLEFPRIAALSVALLVLAAAAGCAAAKASSSQETPPPVYGIEIYEYDRTIQQPVGAAVVYAVKVRNTGVLDLTGVGLSAEKLPTVLFQSTALGPKVLRFGETSELYYKILVPEGFDGTYTFSIAATASYGAGNTSHSKPVQLSVAASPGKPTTTTSTPGVASIDAILPMIVAGTAEKPSAGVQPGRMLADIAEVFFSKFRSGVEYARVTASSTISDSVMLRTIAAALLAIMLLMIVVRNALITAMRHG